METSCILQIHTGSFKKAHTNAKEIIHKLENIIKHKKIKAVIMGWNLDATLNQTILDYFHSNKIECYFWFPVLSEIDTIIESNPQINYLGKTGDKVEIMEDESFSFLCPTSTLNYQNVITIYETYLSHLNFDGVFLDKIRFPSFANGYEEGFGCFCMDCMKQFKEKQIQLNDLFTTFKKHDTSLLKGHYDSYGHYIFEDKNINLFYETRANIITNYVSHLCDYFHYHHLKVGLDIYAPFFAYHVGQDMYALSNKADFLKPMFYRYTNAPAGVKYEYDTYIQHFNDISNFKFDPISKESILQQIAYLKKMECDIYPGIEINPIENICDTNVERFNDSKNIMNKHFETIVCCWNVLLMDDKIKENL